MEWINKMNGAIDYIEANITGKVDYEKAAGIACCSLSRFQNMFLFITDITPSEYVRRRRMVLSANELTNSDIKIIDLSFKYGYESPEAFTRSFKAFHGVAPSEVRKSGKYIDYSRISFKINIIGGHFNMEKTIEMEAYKGILFKIEIIELPETLKFAGLSSEGLPNFQNINAYCQKYRTLMAEKYPPYAEIGISTDISNANNRGWDYIFGCQVDSIDDLPDGLVGLDTGLTKFACLDFRVQPGVDLLGNENGGGEGMQMAGEYLVNEWIPKNKDIVYGYNPDNHWFYIKKSEKNYRTVNILNKGSGIKESFNFSAWIEIYKDPNSADKEMCFYIPLR